MCRRVPGTLPPGSPADDDGPHLRGSQVDLLFGGDLGQADGVSGRAAQHRRRHIDEWCAGGPALRMPPPGMHRQPMRDRHLERGPEAQERSEREGEKDAVARR